MAKLLLPENLEIPKWDIALEALMREEYFHNKHNLRIADIERLAQLHHIRFDDLMVTAFELVVHEEWTYTDTSGKKCKIVKDDLNRMYRGGRIQKADVLHYTGHWTPGK